MQLRLSNGLVLVLPWYPNAAPLPALDNAAATPSRRSISSHNTIQDISSDVEVDAQPSFNVVAIRDQLQLQQPLPEPANPTDQLAQQILLQDHITFDHIDSVMDTLPAHALSDRAIFQPLSSSSSATTSTSLVSGAFVHGPHAGLHSAMRTFPWFTRLLVCIARTQVPGIQFSTVSINRNCVARIHRDSHNHAFIPNHLIPLSHFRNGQLWLEQMQGPIVLDGIPGVALPIQVPYTTFDPWEGTRTVLIAFHIRSAWSLSNEVLQILQDA